MDRSEARPISRDELRSIPVVPGESAKGGMRRWSTTLANCGRWPVALLRRRKDPSYSEHGSRDGSV